MMGYKVMVGDPESITCKVVVRDSLNAAMLYIAHEWPASANDMEASVFVSVPGGGFLRILGISREGVANLSDIRIGLGKFDDFLHAVTSPK